MLDWIRDSLHWLTSEQGLLALLLAHWFKGVLVLALVIFCETGLVVLPFLPGDSLLFLAGTMLAAAQVNLLWPVLILWAAAVLGDWVNYQVGSSSLSQRLLARGLIRPAHLEKTRDYFDRHGGMTIVVARFVPIVRTLAPFVAGLSGMSRRQFLRYNLIGGLLWVGSLLTLGYLLGQLPIIKQNLRWVSLGIIVLSVLPIIHQVIQEWRYQRQLRQSPPSEPQA